MKVGPLDVDSSTRLLALRAMERGVDISDDPWVAELAERTGVATLERVRSLRRYEFRRGEELLARASTEWVWIDTARGRPRPIPQEVAASFEVVEDYDGSH